MKKLQLLIKPVSSACNLKCAYCFYRDEEQHRMDRGRGRMDTETVKVIVDKALAAAQTCVFGFQGGEPTLAGLPFFEEFAAYVEQKKRPRQQVSYTIQTNGTELSDEWMDFFREKGFLVGLSLDGVRRSHDENRKDQDGAGSFSRAFACAEKLQEYRIPFHVLCVLNRQTAERIEAIYRFFCRKGFYAQQYIPCLDPLGEQRGKQSYSLTPAVFESVMKKLFDLWYADQMSGVPVYIRQFENYVEMLAGGQPEACSMYGKCSMQNVIESDGTVYLCDFYALDAWAMGNIKDPALDFVKLWQWSVSEHPAPFFRESAKRDARCSGCRWYPLCRGGCRRDCETEKEGFRNVYCEAYQNFFAHSIGRLERLTALRRHFPYGI